MHGAGRVFSGLYVPEEGREALNRSEGRNYLVLPQGLLLDHWVKRRTGGRTLHAEAQETVGEGPEDVTTAFSW